MAGKGLMALDLELSDRYGTSENGMERAQIPLVAERSAVCHLSLH